MTLKPQNKFILARLVEPIRRLGEILRLNEDAGNIFYVIEVAPEVDTCKSGDTIMVQKYNQVDITENGEKLRLIHSDSVLAVMGE